MIFDAHGNPIRLVVLIVRDPEAGFIIGCYGVDEPPPDDELDEAVLRLYCHQMRVDDDAEVERMRRRISSGQVQAVTAVLDSDEVLSFYEPVPDATLVPLTDDDVGRMSADELIGYRDLLLEQSKEYVPDPTVLSHNAELIADEIRRRLNP